MSKVPRQPVSRLSRFLLMGFIVLCMVFTSGVAALKVYPGLALLTVVNQVKTSPYCPVWRSVSDANVKLTQQNYQRDILAHSHVVRKEGAYKLWSTPAGEYWVPDTSDEILSILLAQQKRKIYGGSNNGGVRQGDIVLDGGAHVGVYVKTALDAGAAKIIAIEPSPEALECLRRNFAKEIAAGKVMVYPKGIWDEEKHLVFYANGNGAAGDSFLNQGANARVIADIPVTTIDKMVKELNLPRVDIIKADIKGAGTRMIMGGVETIRAYHPRIVISVEEEPENPVEIHDAILKIAPSYQFRPGPCEYSDGEIRNDTIFFQ